jgi:hypothetical protein
MVLTGALLAFDSESLFEPPRALTVQNQGAASITWNSAGLVLTVASYRVEKRVATYTAIESAPFADLRVGHRPSME